VKRKRKETNKKKNSTSDRKPKKGEEKDHLKKTSLGPLRQGQRLDTSETKTMLKQRAQTTEPKLEHRKELPLHICKLPLSKSILPLNQCSNAKRECSKEQKSAHSAQGG
jgi:hypothetical protein